MSTTSLTLGSSLAVVGISAAKPRQLTVLRETLDKTSPPADGGKADASKADDRQKTHKTAEQALTPAEQRRLAELKHIDAEVRAHEQAHINVGRGLITSGPSYEYTYGPDGKQYAVAGEVGIDTSPEAAPRANIDKGQRIQDTALAPVDPSPQDHGVAATGRRLEEQGRSDLRAERQAAEAADGSAPDQRLQAYASAPKASGQLDVYI